MYGLASSVTNITLSQDAFTLFINPTPKCTI